LADFNYLGNWPTYIIFSSFNLGASHPLNVQSLFPVVLTSTNNK